MLNTKIIYKSYFIAVTNKELAIDILIGVNTLLTTIC